MKTHSLTDEIRDFFIKRNGKENATIVKYKTFLEVVFYCLMDFSDYPLDEQKCYFLMRDFNYPADFVSYELTPYVSKKVNMGVLWNDKIELYHDGQVPRYVQTSYIKLVGLWA